jgi:hypothetical protein
MDVRGNRQSVGEWWEVDGEIEDLYEGWEVGGDVRAGGKRISGSAVILFRLLLIVLIADYIYPLLTGGRNLGIYQAKKGGERTT